jgi:hypothetical protein
MSLSSPCGVCPAAANENADRLQEKAAPIAGKAAPQQKNVGQSNVLS